MLPISRAIAGRGSRSRRGAGSAPLDAVGGQDVRDAHGARDLDRRLVDRGLVDGNLVDRRLVDRRLVDGNLVDQRLDDGRPAVGEGGQGRGQVGLAERSRGEAQGYGERRAVEPPVEPSGTPGGRIEVLDHALHVVGAYDEEAVAPPATLRTVLDLVQTAPGQTHPRAAQAQTHAEVVGDEQGRARVEERGEVDDTDRAEHHEEHPVEDAAVADRARQVGDRDQGGAGAERDGEPGPAAYLHARWDLQVRVRAHLSPPSRPATWRSLRRSHRV